MCGFICLFGNGKNYRYYSKKIVKNLKKNIHRGPDHQSFYFDKFFTCSFRRLSIQDLSQRSNQPFLSQDKRRLIVFNGEIYNFKDIRNELKNLNCKFITDGDTEVIDIAFKTWGTNFVKKLRGMFSICIYSINEEKVFIARDRFGIKPLYKFQYEDLTFLSSEIKDIKELFPDKFFKENQSVVTKYLFRSSLDDSAETFYNRIEKIEPSTMGFLTNGIFKKETYWELNSENIDENYQVSNLENVFIETMKYHMLSDVPIAFTLSGGIDSSLIAGIAKKIAKKKDLNFFSLKPIDTFDESFWIKSTIRKFKLKHTFVDENIFDLSQELGNLLKFQDEPIQSSNALYQFLLRKYVNEAGFKVVMVGEGADEVFSGYRRCINYYLYEMNFNNGELNNYASKSEAFMGIKKNEIINKYLNFKKNIDLNNFDLENQSSLKFIRHENKNLLDLIKSFRYLNFDKKNFFKSCLKSHIFKNDLPYVLRMEDRNSMAHSIEARVPFLDHVLVENVFKIKNSLFMKNGQNKYLLRNIFKKYFSKEVLLRTKKTPRPGSNNFFIFKILDNEFQDLLNTSEVKSSNLFDHKIIHKSFLNDKKRNDVSNVDFYFRVFCYLKWKII